jgi:tetratricopeptide (TPR) repeat protein
VVNAKAVPWARLGVARVQLADGDVVMARRTLESLLGENPLYADSYDVMGKVQMEQGQIDQALATYRTAANITPGCVLRLQHAGTLSFYAGDSTSAIQMLERTWSIGSKSRLFDVLSMMLLAFLRFDARDTKGLSQACEVLNRFSGNYPQSVRLKRMAQFGFILSCLQDGQVAHGVLLAREALAEVHQPDFDMEAATNTIVAVVTSGPVRHRGAGVQRGDQAVWHAASRCPRPPPKCSSAAARRDEALKAGFAKPTPKCCTWPKPP